MWNLIFIDRLLGLSEGNNEENGGGTSACLQFAGFDNFLRGDIMVVGGRCRNQHQVVSCRGSRRQHLTREPGQ
jgi:hypothetical protein